MQKDLGSPRLLWSLLKEDRKRVFLGLAFGTATSALVPQIMRAYDGVTTWLWNPAYVQKVAVTFLIGVIVASALVLWLIPVSMKWSRSWWTGANHGSFAVTAVAAFVVFRLAASLQHSHWIVAAVLVAVFSLLILFISAKRSTAYDLPRDCSDDPRVSLDEAWPERKNLAVQIADCIRREGKPTYAIYGDFGSGKSSMLNFIDDALRSDRHHRPIIVRFNGWLPGSKENLTDQLLSDIASECSKEYYIPQLRHTALKVGRTIAASVPHFGSLTEWLPQETQGDIVKDLKSVLARLPRRIVVLVVEVDRMRKEELIVLLKLIRGFSSLPHLSFLCALERRQVEKMIKDEFGEVDHTFYHKFFADSYQIPKLVDSFLESETHDALTEIFEAQGWFTSNKQAKGEYSDVIDQHWSLIFSPLCTNIREVHRLASTVRTEARPLVDEVNPVDLTFVSALRYFAPEALELIWKFRDTLCALEVDSGIAESDKAYEGAVSLYLEREDALPIAPLLREQVQRIRAILFSGLETIKNAQGSDSNRRVTAAIEYFERNKGAAQTRSLRSISYFPAYFQSVLPVAVFPEKELQRIFHELGGSDEFQVGNLVTREFRKLDGNSDKRLNFLEKLSAKAVNALDLQRCMWLANVVVGLSVGLDNPHCETEYRLIDRLATSVADGLFLTGQSERRLSLLQICILGARADGVAHRILSSAVGNRPMPDGPIAASRGIQNVPREHLEKVFLERMTSRYGPNMHPDRIDLNLSHYLAFHDWGVLLDKSVWTTDRDLQHKFWMWYINSPERMAQFTRYALSPFYVGPPQGNPNLSLENILPKDDIRSLVLKFPPYQDVVAISTLRELLGSDVLPEPL
jgi:KAP family P-loop domain